MKLQLQTFGVALSAAALLALAACGGGGSDSTSSGSAGDKPVTAAAVTGTAATGAALANANVAITDSAGASPCQEAAITTSALGTYTCTLKTGEVAPFFVVVTDPTGNTAPLVSVSTVTPAAGAQLTINATPLTTAIVAQLAADGNPLTFVSGKTVDAAALQKVTANVVAQLASVLAAIGAPANYDPFSTAITAATAAGVGNTADQVLDIVKVVTDPATGKLALATVDNPTPVAIATATSTGGTLAAPPAGVAALPQAAQAVAKGLSACFALPVAQRVTSSNTSLSASQGGPEVDGVASACQNIAADISNAAGIDFLHNGYYFGQLLYGILTSDSMTNAQFSVPEIMAFYPAASTASGRDEAIFNIRYLDASGNPGNIITTARDIAGGASSAHPSSWWLVGNQQPVDVTLKLQIRRVEQMNPGFNKNNNNYSHFQSGIQFMINAKGPGSVVNNAPLSYARVTGPGLPSNGIVYIAPVPAEVGQNYMDVSNKTGTVPVTAQCGNEFSPPSPSYNCPNFWFSRTAGLSGSAASTLAGNPASLVWAQAADNADASKVVKGAKYRIELFHGTNTTPTYSYNKTLLSDLVPATQGANLPWNTLGSKSLAALDPSNTSLAGAQTSLTADWVQNVAAQQIGGVAATVDNSGTWSTSTPAPRGATSIVVNAAVPAFTATTSRGLLFGYRMLDNSNKSAVFTYN
ncbi:hypothetical protein [Cupriavidus sp. UME77]|uniref:hypothetical protein n=1 Tax=Cupriavidus sp. UME77 TaxID=1862321 RepID=UPI0016042615|nr:hypothetical protein [Cupriavidus sp. UME77]MBB1635084.1 hypothetical protein [Cupriavidus sp. UME77]